MGASNSNVRISRARTSCATFQGKKYASLGHFSSFPHFSDFSSTVESVVFLILFPWLGLGLNGITAYLLVDHVTDEADAGGAPQLVLALEAALKVDDQPVTVLICLIYALYIY